MVLTTPVPRDRDIVIPGENWFLYWNTASSLWESKLQFFRQGERVIVPLNWSFHSETGDEYDFGDTRPETDLKKICDIAQKLGLKITFLFPVSPLPFLVNGGVPHLLARSRSVAKNGMYYSLPDPEGRIYGLYSFFDNRVFKAYRKFCTQLAHYFKIKNISHDIYGIEGHYFEGDRLETFFYDSSPAYTQAFSKFVKLKKEELGSDNSLSVDQELMIKTEFENSTKEIYLQTASELFNDNWEGKKNILFVGAGSDAVIRLLFNTFSSAQYIDELFKATTYEMIPSSILMPNAFKQKLVGKIFEQLVTHSLLPLNFSLSNDDNESTFLSPLFFLKVKYADIDKTMLTFNSSGIASFVETNYRWGVSFSSIDQTEMPIEGVVYSFNAAEFSDADFKKMLNLFINGGWIFLNKDNMSDEHLRRWNLFLLENNLTNETINYNIVVSNISLGDGRVIFYSAQELSVFDRDKKHNFWNKIFSTFSIKHVQLDHLDGVDYYWRTRKTYGNELKYEEIRRLSLFNSTSYKKKFKISLDRMFKIIKFFDEQFASYKINSNIIELELLPEGSLSIDFGLLPE